MKAATIAPGGKTCGAASEFFRKKEKFLIPGGMNNY
jgi:hypothetical protein